MTENRRERVWAAQRDAAQLLRAASVSLVTDSEFELLDEFLDVGEEGLALREAVAIVREFNVPVDSSLLAAALAASQNEKTSQRIRELQARIAA